MKKRFFMMFTAAAMALSVSAGALEYAIDAPEGALYGKATSIAPVVTSDRGERKNEDISKNAALAPPGFGTPTADLPGSGTYLTPDLAPDAKVGASTLLDNGAALGGTAALSPASGNSGSVYVPGSSTVTVTTEPTDTAATSYTEVTEDLYYPGGYLGTLEIPAIHLSGKIYQGTGSSTLKKGIGHFEETSIWGGNVALAAHNRGINSFFGKIHQLESGDRVTLATKLGTRTFEVVSVSKVSETDRGSLASTSENCLTMYTCVQNVREQRWCVRCVEVR